VYRYIHDVHERRSVADPGYDLTGGVDFVTGGMVVGRKSLKKG